MLNVMESIRRVVRGDAQGETGHEYVVYRGYKVMTFRNANSGWYRYRIYGPAQRRHPTKQFAPHALAAGGPYDSRGKAKAAGMRYVRESL